MRVSVAVRCGPVRGRVIAAALTTALALAGACWRDRSPSGPSGPLAVDRVMGRYSEREGLAARTVTFDGAGGTTYSDAVGGGRVFNARGRYWMSGDTVCADYVFNHDSRFAFWALLRGDSLIVVDPVRGRSPLFPPFVRDRPDE